MAASSHQAGGLGLSQGVLLLSGGIMLDTPVVDGLNLVGEYCISILSLRFFRSRNGTRTHTGNSAQQILSLSCLPIPSSGHCTPDRIRTCDRLLRRQMLYPTELREHLYAWVGSNHRPTSYKDAALTC